MKKPHNEVRLEKQIKTALAKWKVATSNAAKLGKVFNGLERKLLIIRNIRLTKEAKVNAKAEVKNAKALKSYGIKFTRRKKLSEIKGPNGWSSSPGLSRVSDRRFGFKKEAVHHGKRFTKIEGHKSFSVFRSSDPVNARINWKTGKTNPIIWLKRTNRK